MKNLLILIICLNIHLEGFSQIIKDIDEVSPFHGDLAAIRKGNQWAFINKEGVKVIDFRDDLVLSNKENAVSQIKVSSYPIFKNGRCLIKKLIDGKYYYGFIDEKGKEIIPPQYLNASNFSNGFAIIVMFLKDTIGFNQIFKKHVVSHKLEEYVIDTSGDLVKYLYNARTYFVSKFKNRNLLEIQSKFVAPHLIAVKNKNNKWNIYNF